MTKYSQGYKREECFILTHKQFFTSYGEDKGQGRVNIEQGTTNVEEWDFLDMD